jgi:hypothetical protein
MTAARVRSLEWARTLGAVSGGEAAERYLSSQVSDLAAYFYPDVGKEELDLACDMMGWYFLFDDQITVPAGAHPAVGVAACQDMILLTLGSPGDASPSSTPTVSAFADVWTRMISGMSPLWRTRTAQACLGYLWGNLAEVADRQHGADLSPESFLNLRRQTVGVNFALAMGERVGHFETPALAWSSNHLAEMRIITIDHIIIVNEVVSLAKEEAAGEPNLILSLMRHEHLTRTQAINRLIEQADTAAQRFLHLEQHTPQLCDTLALSATECSAVRSYQELMRALMRGHYDWACTAGRYSPGAKRLIAP